MHDARFRCLLILASCLLGGAPALLEAHASPAPTNDALVVFDAGNNPGDGFNVWSNVTVNPAGQNLSLLGGPGELVAELPKPLLFTDNACYYRSNGSAWGQDENFETVQIPLGVEPIVTLTDFSFEIFLRRTAFNSGEEETHIAFLFQDNTQFPDPNTPTLEFFRLLLHDPISPPNEDPDFVDFDIQGNGGSWDSTSGADLFELPIVSTNGPFTQIVIAWDNSTQQYDVYKDGTVVSNNIQSTTSAFSGTIELGLWNLFNNPGFAMRSFPGDISLVRLYDRQVSAGEVLQNYNAFQQPTEDLGVPFVVQIVPDTAVVTVTTLVDQVYNLQSNPGLGGGSWVNAGEPVTGNGDEMQLHDTSTPGTEVNYRVFR